MGSTCWRSSDVAVLSEKVSNACVIFCFSVCIYCFDFQVQIYQLLDIDDFHQFAIAVYDIINHVILINSVIEFIKKFARTFNFYLFYGAQFHA